MRFTSFSQALVLPGLLSAGLTLLTLAQHVTLVEPSYADTVSAGMAAIKGPQGVPDPDALAPAGGAPAGGRGGLTPTDQAVVNALMSEFGLEGQAPKTIKAISDTELAKRSAAVSGREDPFIALVPPAPSAIRPPALVSAPAEAGAKALLGPPLLPGVPGGPEEKLQRAEAAAVAATFALPSPPPVSKIAAAAGPSWLVRGVLGVGGVRLALLESPSGNQTLHAKVGASLPDGFRIVAIDDRTVTFQRGTQRFTKALGGGTP